MATYTHQPDDDPTWQESVECHAFDPVTGVGFITASGVFVNAGTGLAWTAACVPIDGKRMQCFQRTANDIAIVAGDRATDRNGVAFLHWEWHGDGVGRLIVDEPDCQIDVTFTDFYPEAHWGAGAVPGATGHVESSGRVRGVITVDGRTHQFDALGHRDQSWGPRSNEPVRSHAWFAGTCGPELSFTAENLVVAAGGSALAIRSGFVVHDGIVDPITSPDLEFVMDWDLFSPLAVRGVLSTESGSRFDIETVRRAPTFLNKRTWRESSGFLAASDTLFAVRCNGIDGIADLNVVPNATAGRNAPQLLAHTPVDDGLWISDRPTRSDR